MKISIQTISPAKAAVMLSKNTNNRGLRKSVVQRYARDMKSGAWLLAGDPIRFGGNGDLLDGQHRLAACISSSVSFQTVVAEGVSEKAVSAIDAGAKRTLGDVLKYAGEVNTSNLAAGISLCWRYDNIPVNSISPTQPSRSEALVWFDANPMIRESTSRATFAEHLGIPRTPIASAHYLTWRVDPEDADTFMTRLRLQVEMEEGDGVHLFSRWCNNAANRREKPSTVVIFATLIKAMNLWRRGDKATYLSWRPGGAHAEDFPRVWPGEKENR